MAKATTSPAVAITATPAVVTLINAAGKAAGTMYSKTLEAAKLAAKELDGSKPMAARIAEIVTRYGDTFKALKTNANNVRSIFVDALTLHACAGDQVTIEGPKNSSQTMSAIKAVETLAKNPMRAAAKLVRDAHGMGRKTTPKETAPAKPASNDAVELSRAVLAGVADHMGTPEFVAKLIALMDVAGYVLQVKAKTAKTMQNPAKPVKMADLPIHRITGAVNQPAPL